MKVTYVFDFKTRIMRAKSWVSEMNSISDARCTCCFSAHLVYCTIHIDFEMGLLGPTAVFPRVFPISPLAPPPGGQSGREEQFQYFFPDLHFIDAALEVTNEKSLKRVQFNSEINILYLPDLVSGRNYTLASCLRVGKDPLLLLLHTGRYRYGGLNPFDLF